MAVGADQGVREGDRFASVLAGPDAARDMLEIDLVADASAGRDNLEIVERLAAPLQELVALAIACIFQFDVAVEGLGRAELVDHHAVIDDEVDGDERVDLLRVAPKL